MKSEDYKLIFYKTHILDTTLSDGKDYCAIIYNIISIIIIIIIISNSISIIIIAMLFIYMNSRVNMINLFHNN